MHMGPTSGPVTHCDTTDPRRTLLVPTALVTYMGTMVPTSCKLCTFDIKVTYYLVNLLINCRPLVCSLVLASGPSYLASRFCLDSLIG